MKILCIYFAFVRWILILKMPLISQVYLQAVIVKQKLRLHAAVREEMYKIVYFWQI